MIKHTGKSARARSVLINTVPLCDPKPTGVGRYILDLASRLHELQDEHIQYNYYYHGFVHRKLLTAPKPETWRQNNTVADRIRELCLRKRILRPFAKQILKAKNQWLGQTFDLYWEPNNVPRNLVRHKKMVVTIHDLSCIKYPQWHPKRRLEIYRRHFKQHIHRANAVITPSRFIKNEVVEELGFDEDRVFSVHNGVNLELFQKYPRKTLDQFAEKHKIPPRFILFTGSLEPRKNIVNLVKAYRTLPEHIRRDVKLALAGGEGWNNAELMAELQKEKNNVVRLGYLDNRELAYAYNLAEATCYPSLYEGFGLPPLESMACGTPPVVSNTASLPEVCGDAAVYVKPQQVEDIARGIQTTLENQSLRGQLAEKGLRRARAFSWDRAAANIQQIFRRVLAE